MVVTDRGLQLAEAKSALHRLEKFADRVAIGGNLHLHALVGIQVDDRESVAGFVEEVLRNIEGTFVPLGAESLTLQVDLIRPSALGAVRGVLGERTHHIELVVVGKARVGCGNRRETHLTGAARHSG